jgi:HlyD family secretion protein
MKQLSQRLAIFLIGVLLLTGCGVAGAAASQGGDILPPVKSADSGAVIAEGVIQAGKRVSLRFEGSGTVEEVLVEEGDAVAAGAVLARLDTAHAKLAAQQAEAALAAAQAQLAQLKAGAKKEQIAVLQAQLLAAESAKASAAAQRDLVNAGGLQTAIAGAEAQVAKAESDFWHAKDIYDRLGWKLGDGSTLDMKAAQAALDAAQVALKSAASNAPAQSRVAEAAVAVAEAQRAVAAAQLALAQSAPMAEQIAAAEAAVKQAQAALDSAQLALARMSLSAPFAGTVTNVAIKAGELAAPAQAAITLATLEPLEVRTRDLTELDVVKLEVGQAATVTLDALPGREFAGHISKIELEAVDYRGDVTYPVIVRLDAPAPELRLGMTALVKIAPLR